MDIHLHCAHNPYIQRSWKMIQKYPHISMMTAGEAVQSRYIIRTGVGETPVRYRLCMALRDCYVERVGHGRPSHDCEGFFHNTRCLLVLLPRGPITMESWFSKVF